MFNIPIFLKNILSVKLLDINIKSIHDNYYWIKNTTILNEIQPTLTNNSKNKLVYLTNKYLIILYATINITRKKNKK